MKNSTIRTLSLTEFTAHYAVFMATAKRFLAFKFPKCCPADIDEFVSDAFLAILEQLQVKDIVLTCRPESFIASICKNKAIDALRKRKKMVYFDDFPRDLAENTPLSMEAEKEALRAAIDTLSVEKQVLLGKKYRTLGNNALKTMSLEAINAHENSPLMTFEDIAAEGGVPSGRLRQAFNRLKPELKERVQKVA